MTEIESRKRLSPDSLITLSRDLDMALRQGEPGSAYALLQGAFKSWETRYIPSEEITSNLARLAFQIQDFVLELGLSQNDPLSGTQSLTDSIPQDVPTALAVFQDRLETIDRLVAERRENAESQRIERAKSAIEARHTETGLSLQDICDEVYMGVSQFSSLFKSSTGMTFVEYLTRIRVDHAMELLKTTDLRTYEIAEKVGYRDPGYFTHIFKKSTEMTTTEYRERLRR